MRPLDTSYVNDYVNTRREAQDLRGSVKGDVLDAHHSTGRRGSAHADAGCLCLVGRDAQTGLSRLSERHYRELRAAVREVCWNCVPLVVGPTAP